MNKQVLDPVCGMTVNPETAAGQTEYQGKTYYFCSPGCKVAFEKEPDQYLNKQHKHSTGHHHH